MRNYLARPGRLVLCIVSLVAPVALIANAGCEPLGVVAHDVVGMQQVAPAYAGLKGQHVAIMVWADEGVLLDHPHITADIARDLQDKLQQGVEANADELKKTTFFSVSKVLQYQEAHPESQTDPPEQIALQFPATRLIYIEVQSLSLHPGQSEDLWRGQAVASVKVIDSETRNPRTVFATENVVGSYPDNSPPEGLPGMNEDQVYSKSLDALTTDIGKLFITHDQDKNPDV
jgi:hypothetical protein